MLRQGKIVFDGTPDEIETSLDPVVSQFVNGEAGEAELAMLKLPARS